MVDEIVNTIDDFDNAQVRGFELALLLLGGFRSIVDDLHAELARQGHPEVRPSHGFALQAIGVDGCGVTELAARLGVSKQAAGKTVQRLVELGYVERAGDPADGRRRSLRLTARGRDVLARSAAVFDALRDGWAQRLGSGRLRALAADLRLVVPTGAGLDIPGWLSEA